MIKQLFTFGGIDLTQWVYITSVTRKVAPAREFTQTTVQGRDGVYVSSSRLESFDVEVQVMFKQREESTIESARTQLAAVLTKTGEQQLLLPYANGYYKAVYTGDADMSRLWQYPSATLAFTVTDPVAYGTQQTQTLTTSYKSITAGGTYRSYPTIQGTPASGSYWKVFNNTTGEFVRVDATFSGSQTVVINMEQEFCTVSGAYTAVTLDSTYFSIEGTQQLRISSGSATITWNERWL